MARIPSVSSLQRRLTNLKQREANLKTRQTNNTGQNVGKGQPRPTVAVKYKSIFLPNVNFIVNAPKAGVNYFGEAALGLAAPDTSPRMPRGFQPAKIKAVIGLSVGKEATAELSKRKYLKYSDDTSKGTQKSFSAPISADTVSALETKVRAIMQDKRDDVKEYGRIWFEPERPIFSESGATGSGATGGAAGGNVRV